jgi:hypothetical protein
MAILSFLVNVQGALWLTLYISPYNAERQWKISLFDRAFQFTIYNGPTNTLVCNKTLIQMSHTKTLKTTPTCFDHQMMII